MYGNHLFELNEVPKELLDCFEEVDSQCGKAWVREIKSTRTFESGSGKSGNPINGKQSPVQGSGYGDIRLGPTISTETTGWRPQCSCNRDPIPSLVLDPFFGAGTVGVVAKKLNRRYVGIELKPEYCLMGKNRIDQACGTLF